MFGNHGKDGFAVKKLMGLLLICACMVTLSLGCGEPTKAGGKGTSGGGGAAPTKTK